MKRLAAEAAKGDDMTKRLHPRLPRIFAQPPLAALLLLCLNLPAYRVVETPITANTWPAPPLVAVGDPFYIWVSGGKSLVFDPDDEYTQGDCGYGFEWQLCQNGPHDHLHGRVACVRENSFYCTSRLDGGPWVTPGTDPTVVYGLKVSDLIEIDVTTEPISGKYKSVQTVYDDYFFWSDYYTEVQVLEYCFDVYDLDVFAP
ncbi:MAG: hypothetical protein IKP58_15230 [Victivallales bacterium]|nr:hypothetical protein [Victivallales bacterium]